MIKKKKGLNDRTPPLPGAVSGMSGAKMKILTPVDIKLSLSPHKPSSSNKVNDSRVMTMDMTMNINQGFGVGGCQHCSAHQNI